MIIFIRSRIRRFLVLSRRLVHLLVRFERVVELDVPFREEILFLFFSMESNSLTNTGILKE